MLPLSRIDTEAIRSLLLDAETCGSDSGSTLYAVVDAARSPMVIPPMIEAMASRYECLFRGKSRDALADQAPWAVAIRPHEDVLDWLLEDGFGKRWASFASSPRGLADFSTHLRKFTMVEDDDGVRHYFRFYDPQVLRQFLPVLNPEQTARFFDGIDCWMVETGDALAGVMRFTETGWGLKKTVLPAQPPGVPRMQAARGAGNVDGGWSR